MEIKNLPGDNHEILDFPKGEVEVLSGTGQTVFLKIRTAPENIGDVLEEVAKIVLTQDAKIRAFDEKNTSDYVEMGSTFVKENLGEILKNIYSIGDSIRLSGKQLPDGSYEIGCFTNWASRLLSSKEGSNPTFREWFLNAAKNYGNKN